MIASEKAFTETVKALLEAPGIDINMKNKVKKYVISDCTHQ